MSVPYKVAVLIPCYNEEIAVGKVVSKFQQVLPEAQIYVYDNNSTDNTVIEAQKAGAIVRSESRQGKGNVVRRMFADIDADIYVMSDGDETYEIDATPKLIETLQNENLDMVIGSRKEVDLDAYRVGHRWGNWLLTHIVQYFFNYPLDDMLSGFRVFSRRFVKSFPAQSGAFEIETELTVYALSSKLPIKEVETKYFARPQGSVSKLSTYKDGLRILLMIVNLVKDERALMVFSWLSFVFMLAGLGFGFPVLTEYLKTGLVPRMPTTIFVVGLGMCSIFSLLIGFLLDSVSKNRKEVRRLTYLQYRGKNGN
ncbi:MAG: glycosyltransferase [Alphaproteobacteria bacterium]|nr:glycosyltransferase [Alphaproteobacteria bacterium]